MKALFVFEMFVCLTFLSLSCRNDTGQPSADIVYGARLPDLRLADGVPLTVDVHIRWRVDSPKSFHAQYPNVLDFNTSVLFPRAMEIGGNITNDFPKVDSVFSVQREAYIAALKQTFKHQLGEQGMTVKEVIVSNIIFPATYTEAMEKAGMQRQLLDAVRQEKILAIENANAQKEKNEAQAKVLIAEAEAEGRVAQINANTEESRRKSELAKAETLAQITRKEAQAEADRNRLLAKAQLEEKTDLKDLEIQRQQEMDDLEIAKSKKARRTELEDHMEFANVVQANPNFANFLINRELASKVGIAVLPTGSDPTVFSGLLNKGVKSGN